MASADLKITFKESRFGTSQFIRIKKGNAWICLSNKALKKLNEVKEDFNNAVISLTPVEYALTQQTLLKLTVSKDNGTVSFITSGDSPVFLDLSDKSWDVVIKRITNLDEETSDTSIEKKVKKRCIKKTFYVSMFGSYSDTDDNYSKWFYTKKGAEDYAELSGWKCEIVMIPTYAPNRPTLLTNFAAFVAKRKLCALLKSDCYGCQYGKSRKIIPV